MTGAIPNIFNNIKMLLKFKNSWIWITLLFMFILLFILFWMAFNKTYYPLRVINPSLPSKSKAMLVPIGLNMAAMMMYMVGMAILTLPVMIYKLSGSAGPAENGMAMAAAVILCLTCSLVMSAVEALRRRKVGEY